MKACESTTSRKAHKILPGLVAGTVVALGVSGCTGAQSASDSGDASNSSSKTLTIAVPAIPQNLDIQPYGGDATTYVMAALSSTLFHYDTYDTPGHGCDTVPGLDSIVPDLAKSATASSDRKTITVELGDAVSAYGNRLTGEDVKWSIERALAISPITKTVLTTLAHVDAANPVSVLSEDKVELHVTRPTPIDTAVFAHLLSTIFDSTEAKSHATSSDPWANDWMQTHLAVFGPWKLDAFTPGDQVTLIPNPNYQGKRGNFSRVILKGVPNSSSRSQLVQTGAADMAIGLSYSDFKGLQGAEGVKTLVCKSPDSDTLLLNMRNAPLSDVKVRKAISMAIDRKALIAGAYSGFGTPAKSGLNSGYDIPQPPDNYRFDISQAKQLLADAGYPNGFDMTLTYSESKVPPAARSAILLQNMLAKVGIRVKLENIADATQFSNTYYKGQYQAVLMNANPAIASPYYAFAGYQSASSTQNSFGYNNPQFEQGLEQLTDAPTADAQKKVETQLAEITVQTMPGVYLVDTPFLYALSDSITGFAPMPYGKIYPVELSRK